MTNEHLPSDVVSVEIADRRLQLDVLAVDGRAAGVTAHVTVVMALSGTTEQRERVNGSLFLTYADDDWRVFGYEIDRGEV